MMVAVSAIETSAIFYKATRDIPENSHYNKKKLWCCDTPSFSLLKIGKTVIQFF
jgi:hypothetical protein